MNERTGQAAAWADGSGSAGTCLCSVCRSAEIGLFISADGRDYWRCEDCEAVFVDRAALPKPDEEFAHYHLHENDPYDPGYRNFLSRLGDPLTARLAPGSCGLDYGCGPGPGLAMMLRKAGHEVRTYDPFFAPDADALRDSYDFIICSEVAEHFHDPWLEFARLDRMLRPGGWIGLMTCFRTEDGRFAGWHYRRDPTHVVFYREETLRHVSRRFGWQCEIPRNDVALMRKLPSSGAAR